MVDEKTTLDKEALFPNLRAALRGWVYTHDLMRKLWLEADSDLAVSYCQVFSESRDYVVCEAFYQDTKHFNTIEKCSSVSVERLFAIAGLDLQEELKRCSKLK